METQDYLLYLKWGHEFQGFDLFAQSTEMYAFDENSQGNVTSCLPVMCPLEEKKMNEWS